MNLLVKEKQFPEAFKEARIVARARPDDAEARQAEAELAFRVGNKSEGTRLVKRWRDEHPEDAEVTALAIGVLARNGQGKRAADEAETWAKGAPEDYRRWLVAARARELEGRTELALAHYRRAEELAPDSLEPRVMLARFQQGHKQLGEAEKTWNAAATRFPDVIGLHLDLALCREQLGDLGGAETAVRDAIARDPENPTVLNFLSYLLADHNRKLDEALTLVRRALESDPQNSAFLDTLGWTYYRLGRFADARQSLEQALRLGATDPVVHEHLGDVYKELRLNDLAKDQYRLALGTDSGNARVKAKLAGLR